MNGQEYRCHPSVIVANALHVLILVAVWLFSQISKVALETEVEPDVPIVTLLISGAAFAALVIYIIVRFFAWRRTYISIADGNFIYDKRTMFFQKRINVRLSRISTVNLQKGITDRIFGTYTVQLDIDSSVTAEKTDFHLVFRADFAKAFAAKIMAGKETQESINTAIPAEISGIASFAGDLTVTPILQFKIRHILLHALLMTPIWSVIVFGAMLSGVAIPFIHVSPIYYPVVLLAGLPVAFVVSFCGSLLKNLILYYDFTVGKTDRELVVSFGLITRRSFRLPLSKTNAIVIKQSFFGRIFGKYYAEILNVGMGDEENHIAPVFCLMLNKEQMEWVLSATVPAFAGELLTEKSPKRAFIPVFLKGLLFVTLFSCALLTIGFFPGGRPVTVIMLPVVFFLWVLFAFAAYRAKGLCIGADKLTVATGVLNRRILIVPYSKIQVVQMKQGPVSGLLRLRHGAVWILSTMQNRHNLIGYFPPEQFARLTQQTEKYQSIDRGNEI